MRRIVKQMITLASVAAILTMASAGAGEPFPPVGDVERWSPEMDELVPRDAVVERLTEDVFRWSEGPVWVPGDEHLLFSDVPENTIWKWSESGGLEVFLKPSALDTGGSPNPSGQGTNGLILGPDGRLLAADHGSRSLFTMNLETGQRQPVAGVYRKQRFNSPNDLVLSRLRWPGAVFFTDPPYGLKGQDESPLKELEFSGVFRLDASGEVTLLDKTLSRPNGIGLSPDERTLYVASSDPSNLVIRAYDLDENGDVAAQHRNFAATTKWHIAGDQGNNDGMAVDTAGNLWATGPGGVFVISPRGEFLGRIKTGMRIANCAFGGAQGDILYMTSHKFLARVRTSAQGREFE